MTGTGTKADEIQSYADRNILRVFDVKLIKFRGKLD